MRRVIGAILLGIAALSLAGFTDAQDIFTVDLDPSWKEANRIGDDIYQFSLEGDRKHGGFLIGTYPAQLPSLHDEIVDNFGPDAKFERESRAAVAGKDCLFAETHQVTPAGTKLVARHLYCRLDHVTGKPAQIFAMSMISDEAEADSYNGVFWRTLRSVRWSDAVQ